MRCVWTRGVALSASLVSATVVVVTMAVAAHAQQPAVDRGQEIVVTVCSTCHSSQLVTASRRTRQQWQQTVKQMIDRGAPVSSEQFLAVVNYLSAHYGRVNVNTSTAEEIATSTDLSPDEANAIVAYRRDHGTINDFDELKKIPSLDAKSWKPIEMD
jgi:competence ComEA-like helix-hairpin-helix protein